MRLLLALLFSASMLLGQGSQFSQYLGWFPNSAPSAGIINLNAATNWGAWGFRLTKTKTVNDAKFYFTVEQGSGSSGDITCHVQADSNGVPSGTDLEVSTSTTPAIPAAGLFTCNGFTGSYTQGVHYWIVLKNGNGTPASNYPAVLRGTSSGGTAPPLTPLYGMGWNVMSTLNSGTSWSGVAYDTFGLELDFSDSTSDGFMGETVTNTGTSNGVFGTQQIGVKLTTPTGPPLNLIGLSFNFAAVSGTPTGSLQYNVYTGSSTTPTLLATTISGNTYTAMGSANGWLNLYFLTTQSIPAGTVIRVTAGETTQSDTSANRWNFGILTVDNSAASEALTPFGATSLTTSTNGTTFTDTANQMIPFALILDGGTPFGATSSQHNSAYAQ